jgi:hypothetical protein
MSDNMIPHDDARKLALAAAKQRLAFRMEFALQGRPACPMTFGGYAIRGAKPYVLGAPPYAEDPRTVQTLQDRLGQVITNGKDYPRV